MFNQRFAGQRKSILIGGIAGAMLLLSIAVVFAQGTLPKGPQRAETLHATSLQGTGFTYQGQLKKGSAEVNGTCDLAFRLYDDVGAGIQIGSPITQTTPITNGLFTTQLNAGNEFGAGAFDGSARWLEIAVSTTCPSGGTFTTLSPREPVSPEPYALTALYTAYKNVVVVTTSGGHYNSITSALNSITDNSATNTYVIYVAPGTYSETITMMPYVDIEGAGELTTKITSTGNGGGTVFSTNNAELRFLTVENMGAGSSFAAAIYNANGSLRLTHVTASASGGTDNIGVYNSGSSSPMMTNVTASASGAGNNYGVADGLTFPSPAINNSAISASGGTVNYGIYNIHGTVTVNNSQVSGSTASIFNNASATALVGTSLLSGGVVSNTGTLKCVFAYNASYVALNSTCQ